jgi:hypothetical protein
MSATPQRIDGSIGVAWYTPEAWQRLAAMPEARIEKSYQDFVHTFERARRELAARGVLAERVAIDVDKMTEWCHRNGYEVNTRGRAAYGCMVMLARDDPDMLDRLVVDRTRVVQ